MIEELFSCAILMNVDLMSGSEYNKYLDLFFMKEPSNEILIQLEYCSSDIKESILTIYNYVNHSGIKMDYNKFGKFLFQKLNEVYKSELLSIEEFGMKMYNVWKLFPDEINLVEPFHTLCYADDCLSWGDEKKERSC